MAWAWGRLTAVTRIKTLTGHLVTTSRPLFQSGSDPSLPLPEGTEPQTLHGFGGSSRLGSRELGSSWSPHPPNTCYHPSGLGFPETKLRNEPRPGLRGWGFGGLWRRGGGEKGEDPRGMTELRVSSGLSAPLFTRPPPSAHFPFPPREEEMVKDYTVAAGTSKGGSGSQR